MRRTVLPLVGFLLAAACGGPQDDPVPDGVAFVLEQTRTDLAGRNVQAQVVNRGRQPVTVEAVELTSPRLDGRATYTGPAVVRPGATTNLTMAMPPSRCGGDLDPTLVVEYSVGEEPDRRTSRVEPMDRYGSVARFLARDCAASRVEVDLGTPAVRGRGRDAVLELPLEVSARSPVRLDGVGSTVLVDVVGGGDLVGTVEPGASPARTVLRLRPARCDVHVVAEDRAGTLLPLRVGVGDAEPVPVLLRLTEQQRAAVLAFVADTCGFGREDDPLNDG